MEVVQQMKIEVASEGLPQNDRSRQIMAKRAAEEEARQLKLEQVRLVSSKHEMLTFAISNTFSYKYFELVAFTLLVFNNWLLCRIELPKKKKRKLVANVKKMPLNSKKTKRKWLLLMLPDVPKRTNNQNS